MMRCGRIVGTALLHLCTVIAMAQVPFALDTSFRTGIVDINVNALALLEDGGILLSGRIRFPGDIYERGSAKLWSDGSRDMLFPAFPQATGGGKLVPWSDGKFYVDAGLPRRLLPSGLIDTSFPPLFSSPFFSPIQTGDFHVYPDGSVLISGAHLLSDTIRGFTGPHHLIWFTNTGYLDTTRTHRQAGGAIYRFAELHDGKFICNGTSFSYGGQPVDRIFRIHPDGALDTTFQTGVFWGSVFSYLPLADGRVYVAGRYRTGQSPGDTLHLARFLSDGTLDPSFNIPEFTNGNVDLSFGIGVTDILLWPDGRMLVSGLFREVNGLPRKSICMIDTTGQVLDAFSECGVGTFSWEIYTYATISSMLLDTANNHLYLCGAYNGYDDGTTNDPLQRFVSRLHLGDISTAIQEAAPAEEGYLHLYPNPASDQAFLHPPPGLQGPAQLLLSDALGRRVWEHHMAATEGRVALPVAGLRPGLYVVELRSGNATWRARLVRE